MFGSIGNPSSVYGANAVLVARGDMGVLPKPIQIADHLPAIPMRSFGGDCRALCLCISGGIALGSLLLYAMMDYRGGRSGA